MDVQGNDVQIALPSFFIISFARLRSRTSDSQTLDHSACASEGRAIRIMSQPGKISGRYLFSPARMRRFVLFRVTALPTERLAVTPNLEFVIPLGDAIRMASGWAYDFPVRRTRLKSVELVSRFLRFISPNLVTS